jgi:hypothetical protein
VIGSSVACNPNASAQPTEALELFLSNRVNQVLPSTIMKDISHLKWAVPRFVQSPYIQPTIGLLEDLAKGARTLSYLPSRRQSSLCKVQS